MAWVRLGALVGSLLGAATVASTAAAKPSLMPLTRVRLYETGVAYFERTGTVGANAVSLPVPASHLDDALKTLVVLSEGGTARLGGVEFASSVSRGMGRALAGAPADGGALNLTALLTSLQGAAVVVSLAHEKIDGRIVDVLDANMSDLTACVRDPANDATTPCDPTTVPSVVVMTRTNDLRRLALADITGVRPTDPAVSARLNAALDALSGNSARVLKELRVLAQGQRVSLGYVSEAPVWRASYRLVLNDAKGSVLQGWALVHNDTDEAWHGVTVDLVNGRPDSFLFPLAAPRYARRELVTPDNPLSTVPQLMRTTPDALWNVDEDAESVGGLGLSGIGEGGGGRGEGIGLGSIGSVGHGSGSSGGDASSLLSVGNLAGIAPSEGVESGALFRYTLGDKLDLRAHGSALVPFLGEGIEARRVALFARAGMDARSAVYITHHGSQTLPAGTLAVFDHGFAGESALPRLKPNETTTTEYGADLDVSLSESQLPPRDEPRALRFHDFQLTEHYVRRHELTEHLDNRSGEPRDVFLALDYVNNARVEGADEVVYDTRRARPYAVFAVAARGSAERTVTVTEGLARDYPVRELTAEVLTRLARAASVPERQRATVRLAEVALEHAEAKRRALRALQTEVARHEADAARFRQHAEALGAARGTEDLVARLLAAEDRAEALRVTARAVQGEADAFGRQCTEILMRLDH
jgi:hypothetical protein